MLYHPSHYLGVGIASILKDPVKMQSIPRRNNTVTFATSQFRSLYEMSPLAQKNREAVKWSVPKARLVQGSGLHEEWTEGLGNQGNNRLVRVLSHPWCVH